MSPVCHCQLPQPPVDDVTSRRVDYFSIRHVTEIGLARPQGDGQTSSVHYVAARPSTVPAAAATGEEPVAVSHHLLSGASGTVSVRERRD